MSSYYFVWQPSSSSLLKHTQSVTPGLRMEQSIRCLDNYHVHFNLKGRAPGTYEPSDNSTVVCIDVGCVHVLASNVKYNCLFPAQCITSVTEGWQEA